jgi:hypothetical protein
MVDTSEKFSWLVRLGYAARGVVYLLLGWLALGTRVKVDAGGQAVFDALQDMPLGKPLLFVLAAGLAGYVAFKLLSAVCDVQHRGGDAKGWLHRVGDIAAAAGYSVLAFAALQFALGLKHSAGHGQTRHATHTALDWSLGKIGIGVVGAGFVIAALLQVKEAATGHFMHRVGSRAPRGIELIGRAGFAARAVVFAIIGWSLVRAAWFDASGDAKGLGEALLSLRSSGLLYTLVATGLMLFGAFSLVVARYRILPPLQKADLKPALG